MNVLKKSLNDDTKKVPQWWCWKGSLMMVLKQLEKGSTMKVLKRFPSDGAKKIPQWW